MRKRHKPFKIARIGSISEHIVKIILRHNSDPIRVYYNPNDIIIHPKSKKVHVMTIDGRIDETFNLVKKELEWVDEDDRTEIIVSLTVSAD